MRFRFLLLGLVLSVVLYRGVTVGKTPDWEVSIANVWTAKDGGGKERLKATDSPDGKLALFEFFVGNTTASVVVVASVPDMKFLGALPVETPNAIDDPSAKISWAKVVSIKWSPNSKYLAVHSSVSKHSSLHIFQVDDGRLREIPVAELQKFALKHAGLKPEELKSSGQPPDGWISPNPLKARVNLTKLDGKVRDVSVIIEFKDDQAPVIKLAA